MIAVVLVFLALLGGTAGTFFLMDGPRRRARAWLVEIEWDRRELDTERERFENDDRRLQAGARRLTAAVAAHEQREAALAAQTAELNRRVVTYAELVAENTLLKTELRNAALHAAYLEQLQHTNQAGASATSEQRDRLGRAYIGEVVAAAKKAVTPAGYPMVKQRVKDAVGRVRLEGVEFSLLDEVQALKELHAVFERATRAAIEREEQARMREQIREEQARQREMEEAEAAVERAERERAAVEAALARALADAAGQHAAQVDALRAQLAEAEAKSKRAVSLARLTRAGHVYVISNVGSFGTGVFKIGMTRRLKPMDRVNELSDASVPFPFDVHAMITCDDAPRLEAALHQRFRDRRVNRVNLRKEFFRVSIEEIVAAVRDHHGEVEYRADAEALEYINSRAATANDLAEIEAVYAGAEVPVP